MVSYTILQNPNGNRYVLYLYWNDGKWNWNYNWLDNDWSALHPSACLATHFISLLQCYAVGEFFPLGNRTSQLLVNIHMNEFDQYVKHALKVKHCIRYADDFVILSEDKKYLETVLEQMKEFLEAKLHLAMHPDKLFIKTLVSGVGFFGWVHFSHHRVLRTATKKKMSRNVSEKNIESYKGMLGWGILKMIDESVARNI